MSKIYFSYVPWNSPANGASYYNPSDMFPYMTQLLSDFVTITDGDQFVPTNKMKILHILRKDGARNKAGTPIPADIRWGVCEFDEKDIATIGWNAEGIAGVLEKSGTHMNIKVITKEELANEFRMYTDMEEQETGLFVALEKNREQEERLLDLR